MMKEMIIKEASLNELDGLASLFDQYRCFYSKSSDIVGARSFLESRIRTRDSKIFIALTEENEIAGFVQIYYLFSSTRMKLLLLLNDLFVDKRYRKQGVSVQLIDKAKEFCEATGSCGLILETEKSNDIANALYIKTSFQLDDEHNYYAWSPNA